jgi:hypothetical protein
MNRNLALFVDLFVFAVLILLGLAVVGCYLDRKADRQAPEWNEKWIRDNGTGKLRHP